MATLASKISEVQSALDALARQHKVPGASLGIMAGDERVELVTGVANRNTGVPVTPSTLFQIGSITKVYTATLVMQLVDEGLVDVDAPVKKYLPDLELADRKARDIITVRHLLTHTSGIEGDYFDDFGRGDDGVEKLVASLTSIGQIHQPGEMWSYCNTGWSILGRLIEVCRGEPYHNVLRERLLEPIGANRTTVLMEEMLAGSCAVGHVLMPGTLEPVVPPQVIMSPSHVAAGSMTSSTPAEVLTFARIHLAGGAAKNGTRVVSQESATSMQQAQAKRPRSFPGGMGFGWILSEWDGERVIGHGGGTIGQLAFLQVLPDRRFGVCLLTNSSTGGALWTDLACYVFEEFMQVRPYELPKLPEVPPKLDLRKYAGRYSRLAIDTVLKLESGQLVVEVKASGPLSGMQPPQTGVVRPIDNEVFLVNISGADILAEFIDFDRNGRPLYLHTGGRVSRRVEDAAPARRAKSTRAKAATRKRPPRS